jgi:hypothetical protein
MEVINEAQEKGIVRTEGVSCHTLEALKTAARSKWVEWTWRGSTRRRRPWTPTSRWCCKCSEMIARQRCHWDEDSGRQAAADKTDECLQFALLDYVDCFTIGAESRES